MDNKRGKKGDDEWHLVNELRVKLKVTDQDAVYESSGLVDSKDRMERIEMSVYAV